MSTIQFNLLPDVKLQYIKTQSTKRTVMLISLLAAGVSLAALLVMVLTVQVAQKKHLKDLTKDIASQTKSLNETKDLNKILTIQNQLNALPDINASKPVMSRIFAYISQLTPVETTISKLDLDVPTKTIVITGSTDSVIGVNKFADTLKFATYKTDKVTDGKPFSDVVTSISRDDKKSSYVITLKYDDVLFSNNVSPELIIPKITSSRSETEKPTLFKEQPKTDVKPGSN